MELQGQPVCTRPQYGEVAPQVHLIWQNEAVALAGCSGDPWSSKVQFGLGSARSGMVGSTLLAKRMEHGTDSLYRNHQKSPEKSEL